MGLEELKWCPGHSAWVDKTQFHKRSASKDGLAHHCKECERKYHRDHYKTKRSKMVHRRSKLKLNYNITIEDFNRMFEEQQGACAICGDTGVKLVVDHNHVTGQVRRLLCHGCNHGLGRFKDNPMLLYRAADYLEAYGYHDREPDIKPRQ